MDLKRLASSRSRMSTRLDESNDMPLHSRISIFIKDEESKKDDSLCEFLSNPQHQASRLSNINQVGSFIARQKSIKIIPYGSTASSSIDQKQLLQLITQQAADQLTIILGKGGINKAKLYNYYTPAERFNKKKEYTMDHEDKPLKLEEEKMLKIQQLIKAKIDEVLIFLHRILKDTSEEMRNEETYGTLVCALENIIKTKSDDFTILNMKAKEVCKKLFHDVKRIEKEEDRLLEGNRSIAFESLRAKDRVYFLNLKQMDYMEKWEKSRRWLHKYSCNKECNSISNYIHDIQDKMNKDEEATTQITSFLNYDIQELEQKRDEYPDKLDNECDMRNRVITQLKEELENMYIHKTELATENKLRAKRMDEWKIYKEKKAIEDAELQRIADEEELARQLEEERIAAELAAEEELLATFTSKERLLYFRNKKKAAKKAAKAEKAAKKKQRRKA